MLSRHFTWAEILRSDKADELGDANEPEEAHVANIKALAVGLEQVRRILGNTPVHITSGYRNPRVNAAVGGVPHSAHALGLAADFYHGELTAYEAAKRLAQSTLAFDQLIYEKSRNIVHVSFDPRMRQHTLSQHEGPTGPTLQGIVR